MRDTPSKPLKAYFFHDSDGSFYYYSSFFSFVCACCLTIITIVTIATPSLAFDVHLFNTSPSPSSFHRNGGCVVTLHRTHSHLALFRLHPPRNSPSFSSLQQWQRQRQQNCYSYSTSSSYLSSSPSPLSSVKTTQRDDDDDLEGVKEFEKWFLDRTLQKNKKNKNMNESDEAVIQRKLFTDQKTKMMKDTMVNVRHGMFSNGRGLEYIVQQEEEEEEEEEEVDDNNDTDNSGSDEEKTNNDVKSSIDQDLILSLEKTISKIDKTIQKQEPVVTIPKEMVLKSTVVTDIDELDSITEDWDVQLSLKLLKECALGSKSSWYGYCCLLTRSNDPSLFFQHNDKEETTTSVAPKSTAPDTLRRWTDTQKKTFAPNQTW